MGINLYDRFAFRFNRILSANYTNDLSNNQYYEERQGRGINISRPLTRDRFTRAYTGIRVENDDRGREENDVVVEVEEVERTAAEMVIPIPLRRPRDS